MKGGVGGRRPVGRSRGRWVFVVMWVGERVLIWRNWAEDGEAWRWRIGEDRAQAGCNGM